MKGAAHNDDMPEPVRARSQTDARTLRSAAALEQALLGLLERRPFDQITVREIAAEAGVHYATFFRHHPTKESLLDRVAADQIGQLVTLTLPVMDAIDSVASFQALARYVDDHRRLWTALLTGGAASTMRAELLRLSMEVARARVGDTGKLPLELAVHCTTALIFETLAWWLRQDAAEWPVDRVATMLRRVVLSISNEQF